MDDELKAVDGLQICNRCLDGQGGECHTPGCILWMVQAPDIPIREQIADMGGRIREVGPLYPGSGTNIHVNTNVVPPPGMSETEKCLCIISFWKNLIPGFREQLIQENEAMFDVGKGVVQSILKSLEHIDPVKLEEELNTPTKKESK